MTAITMDMGMGDVHIDSASSSPRLPEKRTMADPQKRLSRKAKKRAAKLAAATAKPKKSRLRKMALMIDHPQHGRIEVYRMDGKELENQLFLLQGQSFEQIAALKDNAVWIQLAKQGRFFKGGHFFSIDDKVLSEVMNNFENTENKKIPIDFEHASEMKGSEGAIPALGAPAQGWVTALELRGKNLFGRVEWGDLARQYIKEGAYKFISPAIRYGAKDVHTGETVGAKLTSCGLVNIPFLDGMKPISCKDDVDGTKKVADFVKENFASEVPASAEVKITMGTRCFSMDEYMPRLKACLKMGELSTPTECKDQLDRVREHFAVAGGANSSMGTDISSYMMALRDAVGANASMTWDDVLDTVDEMIDEAIEEHEARYHEAMSDSESMKDADTEVTTEASASPTQATSTEADASTNKETHMSDELKVQLKDSETKNVELTVRLKDSETAKTALELQLKEAAAKLTEATAQLTKVNAELVTMKESAEKARDKEVDTEVDTVIAAYGKTKGVSDKEKPALVKLLKNDPETFHTIYPKVDPKKVYLLKDVTSPAGNAATRTDDNGAGNGAGAATDDVAAEIPDQKTLIAKYMREEKLTLDEAVSKAYTEVTKIAAQRRMAESRS